MKIETKTGNPGLGAKGRPGSELTMRVRELKEGQFVEVTGVHDARKLARLKSASYQAAKRAGFLFETRLNAKEGTLRIYRLAGPQAEPDPRRRPISVTFVVDPFKGQRPSENPEPAKRAEFLMRRAGINVDVQYRSKGWYGLTEDGGHTQLVRGAKKLDDVTEAAIRIKSQRKDAA